MAKRQQAKLTHSMPSDRAALVEALRAATGTPEILSALAAVEHARASRDGEPEVPTAGDLAGVLMNAVATEDAADRARAVLGAAAVEVLPVGTMQNPEDPTRRRFVASGICCVAYAWVEGGAAVPESALENLATWNAWEADNPAAAGQRRAEPTMHDIAAVHAAWCNGDGKQKHPVAPLVKAWMDRPRPLRETHLITVTDRRDSTALVRQPARVLVALVSDLEAVKVDGEPFATAGPDAGLLVSTYRGRRDRRAQRGLPFAGPRRLGGHEIAAPVVRALAQYPLVGDERSPIRGDTLRVAAVGYAMTHPAEIDEPTGALLFGANTAANRERWWRAANVYHSLQLTDPKTGRYVTLGHAPADGRVVSLGAPGWFRGRGERWSLSGRLFGPRFDGRRGAGGAAAFQSGLERTLAGLESWLSYSPSAGRGKHGRTPDLLRPVRPGGPGPDTRIPWRAGLALAGEPVPTDAPARSAWGRRYRRRVDALIAAGYLVPANGGASPAGDTVEIVRVESGAGRGGSGALWIRASARYVAAHTDRVITRLPAGRVFGGG